MGRVDPHTAVLVCVPLLLSPLLLNSGGLGSMPQTAARMAGCVALLAVYWASEALPLPVTAMLPLLLFPVLGIGKNKDVAKNYFKDTNVLFIGSLMMAAAIEASGLHKRMALKVMLLVGTHERKLFGCGGPVVHGMAFLMLGAMGASWFLSMWISNTASTAMLIPVVRSLMQVIKDGVQQEDDGDGAEDPAPSGGDVPEEPGVPPPAQGVDGLGQSLTGGGFDDEDGGKFAENPVVTKYSKGLLISVAYASSIGGIATLTGTPTNLVFTGFIEDAYGASTAYSEPDSGGPVSFVKWMSFALPLSFTLLWVMWAIMFKVFGSNQLPTLPAARVQQQYDALGPMSFQESMVLGHFVTLALLWITQSLWSPAFSYDDVVMVSSSTPAIAVAISLFIAPAEKPQATREGAVR
jgi:sodium-dependent dicarboxylate transporter 2/3/5